MRGRWVSYASLAAGLAGLRLPRDTADGFSAIAGAATMGALGIFASSRKHPAPEVDSGVPADDSKDAQAFAESLPFPLLIVEQTHNVAFANQPARDLFGDGLAGAPFAAALRDPDIRSAVDAALHSGTEREVEFELQRNTDRHFRAWVRPVSLSVTRNAAMVFLEDQTETQRARDIHRDFVANASHELRTPLATVAGCVETLQRHARTDPEAAQRFMDIVLRETGRMRAVVTDLLSLNQIELREHLRPTDPVDVSSLVKDAIERHSVPGRESIAFTPTHDAVHALGDRTELMHALDNLLSNAENHGGGAKRIHIRCKNQRVGIIVEDDGPGIGREHLPRLTERFYRVDVPESRRRGGTGLGLAIVKHVVSRHRGEFTVDSRPGEGSSFAIWLERLPSDSATPESGA